MRKRLGHKVKTRVVCAPIYFVLHRSLTSGGAASAGERKQGLTDARRGVCAQLI